MCKLNINSVTTQQIYGMVLEIRSSLPGVDARFTYYQLPFHVEDALGRVFPIPSEFDFRMINVIITAQFDEGPGSSDVKLGNYELFRSQDKAQPIAPNTVLRPGTKIVMAILLDERGYEISGERCPMPKCRSPNTSHAQGEVKSGGSHKQWSSS